MYVIYRTERAPFLVKTMFLHHVVFMMITFDLVIWNLAEGKIKGNFLWLTTLSIGFEQLKRPLCPVQAEHHHDISFFLLMYQLHRLDCNQNSPKNTPLLFLVVFLRTYSLCTSVKCQSPCSMWCLWTRFSPMFLLLKSHLYLMEEQSCMRWLQWLHIHKREMLAVNVLIW